MTYLDERPKSHLEFENLLRRTKDLALAELALINNPALLSGNEFEFLVFKASEKASIGTPFEGQVIPTKDRAFPDIIVGGSFGIEVKATKKDHWTSVGNSVLESSRVETVENIYILFGKLGGNPDIAYRRYEDCLKGIAVTHYPRYQIDMKLIESKSIFHEMNTSYDEIRKSDNPIKDIRAYYKDRLKKGEALWWIDDDIDETATTTPVIKKLSALTQHEKNSLKADVFVLFPEIFSTSAKKFEKIPAYLISKYGVLSPNLRDFFTAGGKVMIDYDGSEVQVPQIIGELCKLSAKVAAELNSKDEAELSSAWQKSINSFDNPVDAWLEELDRQTADLKLAVKVSELFQSAARRSDADQPQA